MAQSNAEFERRHANEQSQHADAVATLHQELRDLKNRAAKEVDSLIETQSDEINQLNYAHNVEVSRLVNDEATKTQTLKTTHDQQRTQMVQEHQQTLSWKNEELAQVLQNQEQAISSLEEVHTAEQAQKDQDHAQGVRQLREDVQRLNAALLTRDDQLYLGELFTTPNLPTRPDEQIQSKFSEIEQMVESLGRLPWKQQPAMWTSEVLQSVGRNRVERVLKKAIVQDLVWCLLFNHIFCSPFRVFGAEGRSLEEEWRKQCGQGIYHNNNIPFSAA